MSIDESPKSVMMAEKGAPMYQTLHVVAVKLLERKAAR
jgi:hypothetical protein